MSVSTNCGSRTQWSNSNIDFDLQLYQLLLLLDLLEPDLISLSEHAGYLIFWDISYHNCVTLPKKQL
jgi:hypothetical protein